MGTVMQSTLRRVEEPRFDDDPHDAPIAPDIIPTARVDRGPPRPANDAQSRERLFAEIQGAADTVLPAVDTSFRASDVDDRPATTDRSTARTWAKRALTVFMFALVSAFAAAAWKHHGDAATQAVADWVPGVSSSSEPQSAAATEQADAVPAQAAGQTPAVAAPAQTASTTAVPAADAEQQIQSMSRDLAAMGQQIVALKASIEQLKASQQTIAAPAPAARATAPKPLPKAAALPPRPAPPPVHAPRQIPPTAQAAAAPPPSSSAVPPPPGYQLPPQAVVQPNGEPVMRPPAPLPLLPERQ
jgi:hypothetical protein